MLSNPFHRIANMKSLMQLLEKVLLDLRTWCSVSTTRDFETVTGRVEHEGLSFLMITLPSFCSDFERSLANGRIDSSLFLGFKRNGPLPAFLQGLTSQVFDPRNGVLLDNPNHLCVFFIRQFCLMWKKIEIPCSPRRVSRSYDSFVETNSLVRDWEESLAAFLEDCESTQPPLFRECEPLQLHHFSEVANCLWASVIGSESFNPETLVPKHGPGTTAEKILGNQKFSLRSWHTRLEASFPSDLFVIPNWNFIDDLKEVSFVPPELEPPCRVVQVPKTLKAPRIIAVEPVCMQYAQQALMERCVPLLERHPLTAGRVNFTDQTVNQKLALEASLSGSNATLDLKDASDRVSGRLVWRMLESVPVFRDALFACRTTRADVPNHGIIPLARFASMGSAMCFPIEAMVFYTIAISAILRHSGRRVTLDRIKSVSKVVRVYGDDIIVPSHYALLVKSELEYFNLRVNANKSFWTGKFRESCGLDAFDGHVVTPTYVRRMLPSSPKDHTGVLSAVSLRNQLYKAGLWSAARYVHGRLERINIPLPSVTGHSPIIGLFSFLKSRSIGRWNALLHRWETFGIYASSAFNESVLDSSGALMKHFLRRGVEPFMDKEHLLRSSRPSSVYTKKRWAPPV
jgi:hypothetical protein